MATDWKNYVNGLGYGHKETLTSSGTWNWANAGRPKKIFIEQTAGGGGNARDNVAGSGTAGGDTVWDTGAVVATTTCTGGGGATGNAGAIGQGGTGTGIRFDGGISTAGSSSGTPSHIDGFGSTEGMNDTSSSSPMGASGEYKSFEYVPTANVSYTIGAGGAEGSVNCGNGIQGCIKIYY